MSFRERLWSVLARFCGLVAALFTPNSTTATKVARITAGQINGATAIRGKKKLSWMSVCGTLDVLWVIRILLLTVGKP